MALVDVTNLRHHGEPSRACRFWAHVPTIVGTPCEAVGLCVQDRLSPAVASPSQARARMRPLRRTALAMLALRWGVLLAITGCRSWAAKDCETVAVDVPAAL